MESMESDRFQFAIRNQFYPWDPTDFRLESTQWNPWDPTGFRLESTQWNPWNPIGFSLQSVTDSMRSDWFQFEFPQETCWTQRDSI